MKKSEYIAIFAYVRNFTIGPAQQNYHAVNNRVFVMLNMLQYQNISNNKAASLTADRYIIIL